MRAVTFSCEQVATRLSDAVDGELSALDRLRIRVHLLVCPPCEAMRASLQRTIELLRRMSDAS